jgi:hypothetical protein
MTTTFYPAGTWNDPDGRYITDYSHMSKGNPGVQTRTQFTTGYAGHQPDIKYRYGYGSVGPERAPRIQAEVEANAELPSPLERHTMRATARMTEREIADRKAKLNRSQSVPDYARPRHRSYALNHIFPMKASDHVPACPSAYTIRNPTAQVHMKPLRYSSTLKDAFPRPVGQAEGCIDRDEPVTMPLPQGVAGAGGTGYDACAGIVNTWWPKEKPEFMHQTLPDFFKTKYSTSTGRTYKPPTFYRHGNPPEA